MLDGSNFAVLLTRRFSRLQRKVLQLMGVLGGLGEVVVQGLRQHAHLWYLQLAYRFTDPKYRDA